MSLRTREISYCSCTPGTLCRTPTFLCTLVTAAVTRARKSALLRFPDASYKGLTYYAITRALQMKFMRLPKSQVKVGQTLPDTYR